MPQTKKLPTRKPKAPSTPYFVEKYPDWETKSLPRSWKSVTTTANNNSDWLENREQMWHEQKRNYAQELRTYKHKLEEYEKAQFQMLRNSVVAQAAKVAKERDPEFQALKTAKKEEAKAAATLRKQQEANAAQALVSQPRQTRGMKKVANKRKTRKN